MTELARLKFYATQPHVCSYLPEEQATTLFLDPSQPMDVQVYADLSEMGFRRSGDPKLNMEKLWLLMRDLRAVSIELGFPLVGRAEHFQGRVGGQRHGHAAVGVEPDTGAVGAAARAYGARDWRDSGAGASGATAHDGVFAEPGHRPVCHRRSSLRLAVGP